jgi:hypothetical protein
MPSDAEAQDITLKRSAIVTLLMVARWVKGGHVSLEGGATGNIHIEGGPTM